MGKAKRFSNYDSVVAESRKVTQSYGQARQDLSTKSFRSMPQEPPVINAGIFGLRGEGTGEYLTVSMAADQTTNIAATNHVEFDTIDEDGGIELQTGVGQADGIFELLSGRKYIISAQLRPEFSGNTGQLVVAWYDRTNAAELGSRAIYEAQTNTSNNANQPLADIIVTPDTNIDVEVRIISVTALTALANEYCIANLFEISLGGFGASAGGGGGNGGVTFPLTPDINALGNTTGATTINLSLSTAHYTSLTLTGNVTFTFSNPPASGKEMSFVIDITQDATGGRTVTWPASVRANPTIGSGVSARTVVVGSTVDGGTNYDVLIVTGGSVTPGATKALDNLASVAINTSLLSDTDDTDDLGSASKEWKNLFIDGTANIDTLAATQMSGTLTMAGAAIATVGDFSFNVDDTHDIGTSSVRARDVFTHDLRVGSTGAGVGGARQVYGTSSGLRFNTPTATKFFWDVNNVNKFDMSDSTFTGPNIILLSTLTINDSSTDPSANGQFQRNGADLKVFSGDAVRNLSDISTTATATVALDNLVSVAINESLISDTDDTDDLGSAGLQWKDLHIDGTANIDTLSLSTSTGEGVSTTILPTTDANLDLGSALRSWDVLFVGRVTFDDDKASVTTASPDVIQMTTSGMEFNLDTGADKYFWNFDGTSQFDMSSSSFVGPNAIFSATLTCNGNTTLGSDSADTLSVNALIDTKLLPSDGTKDLGDSTTGWNNIFSDNTLFCSNFKVFTGDSDINVFNDLDMQTGDTVDFADISTSAGAGSRTLPSNPQDFIKIKVNGVTRLVPFYPV